MKLLLGVLMLAGMALGQDHPDKTALANERMAKAKTMCYSAESSVQWPKNYKSFNSLQVLAQMDRVAHIGARGYKFVAACIDADLVMKLDVDQIVGYASIEVTDADSGEMVYTESRKTADLSNDLYRLAVHFRAAHTDAIATMRLNGQ